MTNTAPVSSPRAAFYIDGFNMYHGLMEHSKSRDCRWLNLRSLAEAMLLPGHSLASVVYFTSIPPWNPGKQRRHETYLAALKSVNVEIVQGRFQRDQMLCTGTCGQLFTYHVEKLTDVNIATRMLRDSVTGVFDWAYLVSGDADQAPTLRTLRLLDPTKQVRVIFPPRRVSAELTSLADDCPGELSHRTLRKHLFADTLKIGDRILQKPATW